MNYIEEVILIGGGDYTKKVIRLLTKLNVKIIGYTDIMDKGSLFGVNYIGADEKVIYKYHDLKVVLCIAGNKKHHTRNKLIGLYKQNKAKFPTYFSSNAIIDETVSFGEGVVVFDGAYIDYGVKIGSYSVINLNTTIGHDTYIGSNCVISPEVITGGGSLIGDNCFIGMNSTINPYLKISNNCIIGAGSVVTKDCVEPGIYMGNPAKLEKSI